MSIRRLSTLGDVGCLATVVLTVVCLLLGAYTCIKNPVTPATTSPAASPASRTVAAPTPRSSPVPVAPVSSDFSFIAAKSSNVTSASSIGSISGTSVSPSASKFTSTRRLSALSGPRWKVCNDPRTGRTIFTQNDCAGEIVQPAYMCAAVHGFPHCEPPVTMDLGEFGIGTYAGAQVRKGYPEWIWTRDGVVVAWTPKVFTQAEIDTLNGGGQ